MPAKKHTPAPPATTASTRLPVDAPSLPPAAVTVLAVLDAENPTTNAEAVERTGLARSTVTKALSTLLDAGLATRQDGGHDGTLRIPDRWYAAPWKTDPAADGGQDAEHRDDQTTAPQAEPVDGDVEKALELPPAAHKILALLDTENPTTVTEMAERTGLGRSTANKALTALRDAGLAVRQDGGLESGRPAAARWFAAPGPTDPDADQTRPHLETDDAIVENGAEPHEKDEPWEGQPQEAAEPESEPESIDVPDTAERTGDATGGSASEDDAAREEPAVPETAEPCDTELDDTAATRPEAEDDIDEPDTELGDEAMDQPEGDGSGASGGDSGTEPQPEGANTGCPDLAADNGKAPEPEAASPGPRLGKGELRAQAEAHMRAHPDRSFTSTELHHVLNRSSGAIANACEILVKEGKLIVAQEKKPRRFQWNTDASSQTA